MYWQYKSDKKDHEHNKILNEITRRVVVVNYKPIHKCPIGSVKYDVKNKVVWITDGIEWSVWGPLIVYAEYK